MVPHAVILSGRNDRDGNYVPTINTLYQRISHQCVRMLGRFVGNPKSPTELTT
jgi:hypothetical protein